MHPFQLLPAAFVALMHTTPALAAATSKNDPFRAIVLRVPPVPNLPVCCLRPLPPLEPVEDNVLLSFEEWKVKQSAAVQDQVATKEHSIFNRSAQPSQSEVNGKSGNESDLDAPATSETVAPGGSLDVDDTTKFLPSVAVSPHFRVPLTDRFNYANLDCSARVHLSHRAAKSSSSILSSKRDRYMLSPCSPPKNERQFVVVELCEDIRIDTVQLANFEFFSGVFKEFSVSVAKTYTTDAEGWTTAGTYRAKNIRGVQSFHPPTSLRDFYRYIRIDFLSHYGNEFYCPVSLLRVYGLTHLEEWKWETWEAESRAKHEGSAKADVHNLASVSADSIAERTSSEVLVEAISAAPTNDTIIPSDSIPSITSTSTITSLATAESTVLAALPTSSNMDPTNKLPSIAEVTNGRASTSDSVRSLKDIPESSISTPNTFISAKIFSASTTSVHTSSVTAQPETSSSDIIQASGPSSSDVGVSNGDPPSISRTTSHSTITHAPFSGVTIPTNTIATTSIATPITVSMPAAPPPIAVPTGGESIYRTIMNRLTALESNHTLHARYVEQQTSGVREMLRRLGEDVGRLEGIGRAQAQIYERTVNDWEKRQQRLQMEYGELMSRVEYLSDEIVLEKRLGIAQLCLLLAVLVFMGLTRGSRGESFMEHAPGQFNRSMREWGKRHLSFSGDWTSRFRSKSRSSSVASNSVQPRLRSSRPLPQALDAEDDLIEFPSTKTGREEPPRLSRINSSLNNVSLRARRCVSPSEALSLRTGGGRHHQQAQHQQYTRPTTPTSAFRSQPTLHLQQSTSQGGVHYPYRHGNPIHVVPRSARRWARTAHLHEVKQDAQAQSPSTHRTGGEMGPENETGDVPSEPATVPRPTLGRWGRDFSIMVEDRKGGSVQSFDTVPWKNKEAEGDPWEDTDLDAGESEEDVEWELKVETLRGGLMSGKEH